MGIGWCDMVFDKEKMIELELEKCFSAVSEGF